MSVEYKPNNSKWYSPEYLPDNWRIILMYVPELGTLPGIYYGEKWIVYKMNCEVNPLYWREMPRYESKDII